MARTIAIGDIHGCSLALESILIEIDPQSNDTIITLGDYVDRGPDSKGVIDQLIALKEKCNLITLMGNHEQMLLASKEGKDDFKFWLRYGGKQTLDSYNHQPIPYDHISFIKNCISYYETDTHIFVHANYDPGLLLDEQTDEVLRWQHMYPEIMQPHCSGKTVIVGHTPQKEVIDLGFCIMIDTECNYNGWLTAIDVETKQTWQADKSGKLRCQTKP